MDLGYAAGGFADGLGGGLRTALDVVDFRDRRRFADEDRKNKAEDRKLALEDRTLARQDGERSRRIATMQEALTTDQFNETQRQSKLRDAVRGGLAQRVQAENQVREQAPTALENGGFGGEPSAPQAPPSPKGTLAMYDDMLDNPPPEWLGDPDYAKTITMMRDAAEKEGLGEVYSAWRRKATPKEIGKIYNRFGNHFATEIKPGTAFTDDDVKALGYEPSQKSQLMVLIDDKGKHIPMHMGELGRFLGKESAPKYVKGPDNSGVVYDETNPRNFVQFPDQQKPEDRMKAEEFRLKLGDADRKAWDNNVSRLNTAVKNSYQSGSEVNFDPEIGAKQLRAQALGQTWMSQGMTHNGAPVEPERIGEIAREVVDGRMTKEQLDAAGFSFAGRPSFMRGGQSGGGGGGGARPFVVQSDARPTAPPTGAPADGNWRRTEQGWIYVDKSGANAWQDDAPAPAKPPAGKAATPKPAAPKQAAPAAPQTMAVNPDNRAGIDPVLRDFAVARKISPGPVNPAVKDFAVGKGMRDMSAPPTALDAAAAAPIEPGNIDLKNRKVLNNGDGTYSTESSITITDRGPNGSSVAVNIPTVVNGKRLSEQDAEAYYRRTGQHLGKFRSIDEAVSAAKNTHLEQEKRYEGNRGIEIPPRPTGGKGFTSKRSGDMEIYRFADGEVGFFEKNPEGDGMMFRRVDGRGQTKGTPIMVKDRETFIRIHSKGPR